MSQKYSRKNGDDSPKVGLYVGLLLLFGVVLWLGSSLVGSGRSGSGSAAGELASSQAREQISLLFARVELLERELRNAQASGEVPAPPVDTSDLAKARRVEELEGRVDDLERKIEALQMALEAAQDEAAQALNRARETEAQKAARREAAAREAAAREAAARKAAARRAAARKAAARKSALPKPKPKARKKPVARKKPKPRKVRKRRPKPKPARKPEVGPNPTVRSDEGEPPEDRKAMARSWMEAPESVPEKTVVIPATLPGSDGFGRTVETLPGDELASAVATGLPEVLANLLDNGLDANSPTSDDRVALHAAAELGLTDMARLLLDAGADVDRVDAQGRTPLRLAIDAGYLAMVRLLLNAGASPLTMDSSGDSTLRRARLHRDPRIKDLVLDRVDPGTVPEKYW